MDEPKYTFANECVDFTQRTVCFLLVSGLILGAFFLPGICIYFFSSNEVVATAEEVDRPKEERTTSKFGGISANDNKNATEGNAIYRLLHDGTKQGIYFFTHYTITGYVITHIEPERIKKSFESLAAVGKELKDNGRLTLTPQRKEETKRSEK